MLEIISLVQRLQGKTLLLKARLVFCTLSTRIINRIVLIDYLRLFLLVGNLEVEPDCEVIMSSMELPQRPEGSLSGWVFRPPFLQLIKLYLKCSLCRLHSQASLIRQGEILLSNVHLQETLIQVDRAQFILSHKLKVIMWFRFRELS
jgi:hypothetical protein